MNRLFWLLIIFEAAVVFGLAILNLIPRGEGGPNVLDKAIGLVVAAAFILLTAVAFAYWNTRSAGLHLFLLILVAAPLVVAAPFSPTIIGRLRLMLAELTRKDGRLEVFAPDPTLSEFVAAIYDQDSNKVRTLAGRVDINAVSADRDYTPLKLAVERAVEAERNPEAAKRGLEMVRLLLSLGAKPNSALYAACAKSSRTDAVRLLLDAGADPNNLGPSGSGPPAFYGCLNSSGEAAGLEGLKLMADKGANFTFTGGWAPPLGIAAMDERWETVLFLHQCGLPLRSGPEDRTIDGRVGKAFWYAKESNREPAEALKRLVELLKE